MDKNVQKKIETLQDRINDQSDYDLLVEINSFVDSLSKNPLFREVVGLLKISLKTSDECSGDNRTNVTMLRQNLRPDMKTGDIILSVFINNTCSNFGLRMILFELFKDRYRSKASKEIYNKITEQKILHL
jgi:hypothetical protein